MRFAGMLATVALGGALGSMTRFALSNWFVQRFGAALPWGTLAVNLAGSFLIGVVLGVAASRASFDPYLRTLLAPGFLGGFTTFSAYSFETYALLTSGAGMAALAYAGGSVVLGVAAAALGVTLVRAVL